MKVDPGWCPVTLVRSGPSDHTISRSRDRGRLLGTLDARGPLSGLGPVADWLSRQRSGRLVIFPSAKSKI